MALELESVEETIQRLEIGFYGHLKSRNVGYFLLVTVDANIFYADH